LGLSKDKQQERGYNEQQSGGMVISQDLNRSMACTAQCSAGGAGGAGGQLGTSLPKAQGSAERGS